MVGKQNMKNTETACPDCGSVRVVAGRCLGQADYGFGHVFRPRGLKLLKLSLTSSDVPMSGNFRTCLDCGLLWNRLDPNKVKKTIQALGKDTTKRKLNLQDSQPALPAYRCPGGHLRLKRDVYDE